MVGHGQVGPDTCVGGLPPLVGVVELLVALGWNPIWVPGPKVGGGAAQGDQHLCKHIDLAWLILFFFCYLFFN